MQYTVYHDYPTGNNFVISEGIVWSVSAMTTVDSRPTDRLKVECGVLIPNCEVTDWRWQLAGPNGWGDHSRPCEARATQALEALILSGASEARACKTNPRVV
jgi:hypothetical protein